MSGWEKERRKTEVGMYAILLSEDPRALCSPRSNSLLPFLETPFNPAREGN